MSDVLNNLQKLKQLGVSPWYDNIERRLINKGFLKNIFDLGVLGVTSNPAIFEKAINSSSEYDLKVKELAQQGLGLGAIYDELTVWDVRDAADLLKDVYEKSNYADGYVSIEVLPEFAHSSADTINYGRHIFKKINQPNIMIKIPGTEESHAAIRALIHEGINVNVTLIFSTSHYKQAALAYIEGLKDREQDNLKLNKVNSVASVFVSRLDTEIDRMLEEMHKKNLFCGVEKLQGKAAIANCKMIYGCFKEIFEGKEFMRLREKGANPQRVLWASTGTKNPLYSDVKYVDGLIHSETVNTMPAATLDAYLDHGSPMLIDDKEEEVKAVLKKMAEAGINVEEVCQQLQDSGVALFCASYNKLLSSLKNKISMLAPESKVYS